MIKAEHTVKTPCMFKHFKSLYNTISLPLFAGSQKIRIVREIIAVHSSVLIKHTPESMGRKPQNFVNVKSRTVYSTVQYSALQYSAV